MGFYDRSSGGQPIEPSVAGGQASPLIIAGGVETDGATVGTTPTPILGGTGLQYYAIQSIWASLSSGVVYFLDQNEVFRALIFAPGGTVYLGGLIVKAFGAQASAGTALVGFSYDQVNPNFTE
jgi:hypothetical protein